MVAENVKNVKMADFASLKSSSFSALRVLEANQNAMNLSK